VVLLAVSKCPFVIDVYEPVENARVAGMFQVAWEDLAEHPSFPDTACSVTTWK
jgi:hypothetical protein